MIRPFILLNFLLFAFASYSQLEEIPYNTCSGRLSIYETKVYQLIMKGESKPSTEFTGYPSLSGIKSSNQIWLSFEAPAPGMVSFKARSSTSKLKMVVFESGPEDFCLALRQGTAEVKRLEINGQYRDVGLDVYAADNFLYPMTIESGRIMSICLIGESEVTSNISLEFIFTPDKFNEAYNTRELDFRTSRSAPSLSLIVKNAENNESIIADVTLEGKGLNGLYRGSDLKYTILKSFKLSVRCDAEGFFFSDTSEIRIFNSKNKEIVIYLEPIRAGKKITIEQIQFKPGTSEIATNGEGNIRRLRDFLALNSKLEVEIQGHVYEPGDHNSYAGQKLSEARARTVMKYLIDNGIDRARLTAVGFGNTKPIYVDTRHASEQQANRRVEILIK